MRRLLKAGLIAVAVLGFTTSANAGVIKPGDEASCNNANTITLEAQGTSAKGDRANANAVIWRSSTYSTNSITLGPNEESSLSGDGHVGMADKQSMGRNKVVLTKQPEYSRGDSVGDIGGLVKITNSGTIDINVTCN